ncbi:HEAT repeat domain-containing protein [Flavobacterium bizetiae]|uniref:HEAT repeat domain-containing protein n=1 Tax=Flavobacterium bizetiae TaxID=2704140 RepID=UPI0037570C82
MLFGLFKSLDEKVKEDKEKLISALKYSDVKTLIIEMGNDKPISNNVIKKQKRDQSFGSEDFPSWFAYRISDELRDINLKSELIELLNEKEYSQYKKYILRCLSSLCVNCNDYELFDFLISELKKTNKEEIITTVLSRFNELRKPANLNIDYLKQLLLKGTYQNRIDALNALKNSEHKDLEEILIEKFNTTDQHTKCMICATLRSTGTTKSLEILQAEFKRTRSNDLKYFIKSAIEEINERENSNF